jgi:glycosyltransferase involved in cell wall biosynthesis
MTPSIAVLIPCYNEQATIAEVVVAFRTHVPGCTIFVYDNASTDGTVTAATEAGAVIRREPLRGKGNVVRRMFADIEADIYILVDGDGTYDASSAPRLIDALLRESLDLVNAARVDTTKDAYRAGHRFGNWLLTATVAELFGKRFTDMLSGYRVMSRRFVKSFPALSSGFEIETELAVHALQLRVPIAEVPTAYRERPPGSFSKLRTFRDGARILATIASLLKDERPMAFFGSTGALAALVSIALVIPLFEEYMRTGLVPRLPTAVLATGLMIVACLSFTCALILQAVTRGRLELKRLHYSAIPLKTPHGP